MMCKKMLAAALLLTMAFTLSQARDYKVMSFNVRMGDAAIQDGENRWTTARKRSWGCWTRKIRTSSASRKDWSTR